MMSRSGYSEECDGSELAMYRGQVASAIRGKRGQTFLRELATAMDAMPVKELIANELIRADGACCTIGIVCKSRNIDVSKIDYEEPMEVARAVDVAWQLAAEIEWENDDRMWKPETPSERWTRMRKWVDRHLSPARGCDSRLG
jgi:hypothetical protein